MAWYREEIIISSRVVGYEKGPVVTRVAWTKAALSEGALKLHLAGPQTLTGDFRLHLGFRSKFLAQERDIIVYLPPGYEDHPERRYPVLYLHDGQNLFNEATAFGGQEWRVDETAEALIAAGVIEPLIIVGVYNTGAHRIDEYTPTRDGRRQGGKAGLYGLLLVKELKPLIDARYRTLQDAAHTGLGGSSLGGLVSLYLGLKYPQTFGKLAALSPAVWWDQRAILRHVLALRSKPPTRIWLDVGTLEGHQTLRNTAALRDLLLAQKWVLDDDLKYFEAEGAEHNERAWAGRVEPMLRFLFPAK